MGCDGGETLWERLDQEVKRLTSERTKGKHFSEDFVVDRVCTLLTRLRLQHDQQAVVHDDQDNASTSGQAHREELESLRAKLASEELKLQTQQAEIEKARAQVLEARSDRAELDQEWEKEREQQRLATDKHARTWKETTLRSQLCQARLKAIEQEGGQLRAALGQPETLTSVWDGLITKLQAELDAANVEGVESKQEHDRLLADCLRAERKPSKAGTQGEAGQAVPSAPSTAAVPQEGALAQPASSSTQPAAAQPNISAVSAPTSSNVTATERPRPAQPSATGATAEAPYSTASILNDARRALEKLEQLKVRRNGNSSYTGPGPSAPLRSAGSPVPAQSNPSRGGTRPVAVLGGPGAKAPGPRRLSPSRPMPPSVGAPLRGTAHHSPQLSASSVPTGMTPQQQFAVPAAMPKGPVVGMRQSLQAGSLKVSRAGASPPPMRHLVSPSSSVPPTPDMASRLFSAARALPKQASPVAFSAGASNVGVPQDNGVVRLPLRSA